MTEWMVVLPCEGEGCTNDSEVTVAWVRQDRGPSMRLCVNCLWKGAVMPDA